MAFTVGGAGTSWVLGPCSCRKVSRAVDSEACVYRVVGGGGRVLSGHVQCMDGQVQCMDGQVQWMDGCRERLLARSVVHRAGAAGTR